MNNKMRVLIADDHTIFRDGLKAILEAQPDIEVVAEARDGDEAVEKAKEIKPDIVLMDITMPGMSGLDATREIKKQNPEINIVALTMHEGEEPFFQMIEAGASGYFVKGGSSADLVAALRTVQQGDVYLYPSLAKKLLHDFVKTVRTGKGDPPEAGDGLTEREREVLKLIAGGRTNQEIADALVVSVTTVQTHRAHIMAKLGIHNRTELVKFALRRGLITLDG